MSQMRPVEFDEHDWPSIARLDGDRWYLDIREHDVRGIKEILVLGMNEGKQTGIANFYNCIDKEIMSAVVAVVAELKLSYDLPRKLMGQLPPKKI